MSSRQFGLDLLRALAILLVIAGHTIYFFDHNFAYAYKLHMGLAILGVEIFFVLSGFLVGRIAIRGPGSQATSGEIARFWGRRWLRTLPSYYLFLLAHFLISREAAVPWSHLFLVQNLFAWRGGEIFDASWSLATEEWFYLLLPLGFVGLRFVTGNARRAMLWTIFAAGGLSLVLRQAAIHSQVPWDSGIRKAVFLRFDTLMAGVALAYLEHFRAGLWAWLQKNGAIAGAALFSLAAALVFLVPLKNGYVAQVILFPLITSSLFFLIPWLAKWKSADGTMARAVTATAALSYALYLSHTWVQAAMYRYASELRVASLGAAAWSALGFLLASVAMAWLVYHYFERPILEWRDKALPGGHPYRRVEPLGASCPVP